MILVLLDFITDILVNLIVVNKTFILTDADLFYNLITDWSVSTATSVTSLRVLTGGLFQNGGKANILEGNTNIPIKCIFIHHAQVKPSHIYGKIRIFFTESSD